MNPNNELTFPIADITGRLIFQNIYYKDDFFKNYIHILTQTSIKPDYIIKLLTGNKDELLFSLESNHMGKLYLPRNKIIPFGAFNFMLKGLMQLFLFQHDISLFHASAMKVGNKAYIFAGPPCAGKSTIISFVPQNQVLSDDLVVIKKKNNNYFIYTSPMDRVKLPNYIPRLAKLHRIFFLKKSSTTKINSIKKKDAINRLFDTSYIFCFYRDFLRTGGKNYIHLIKKRSYKLQMPKTVIDYLSSMVFNLSTQISVEELEFEKNNNFLTLL